VQLADKLEAKQAMAKADWECWKKLEEGFKQYHGLFLCDLVDDDQEDAHQSERIRQRWTVELSQHGQEMDMLPYSSLSPPLNSAGPTPRPLLKGNRRGKGGKGQGKP
jgi:hypothetical protein